MKLQSGDKYAINYCRKLTDNHAQPAFAVKNDTLNVALRDKNELLDVVLTIGELKSVTLLNSDLELDNCNNSNFSIEGEGGKLRLNRCKNSTITVSNYQNMFFAMNQCKDVIVKFDQVHNLKSNFGMANGYNANMNVGGGHFEVKSN